MGNEIYDDLPGVMGDLEIGIEVLETMILNGENPKANGYLREAIQGMKMALSDISDAEFEVSTTLPYDHGDDEFLS